MLLIKINGGGTQVGREFLPVFSNWAETYDAFVTGKDPAYAAVFENYSKVLGKIAVQSGEKIIEFGSGTGNLTLQLLHQKKRVMAVEPSPAMRKKASSKLPKGFTQYDGDLLEFPEPPFTPDTIVSSFVFHHLNSEEKRAAIEKYYALLPQGGKVIFADTMFLSLQAFQAILRDAKEQGYDALLEDLISEYYPLISELEALFKGAGFTVSFEQQNSYAWLVTAYK